ncbi:MAG: hypothetical protein F6K50_31280 [Moorea sp. SIO3I7]|uniref:hypothetical protein n=1 Tax=unclassified Moorena TaxID=2683338 RepID=UPI0013BEE890|nr:MULTISPECIES: hypothetical protein [unclassified Moorena]NEN99797.1 hypothetical protein [Moorena sp. SIO3I7]NEO08240.1 hypothetical protein [Moorena sp. SIO3I8]NEO20990.1 hypothetical protein [Moorena sp. SIO4A5]NEP22803.1 hypothetical protein [Moorena sp. SIO3I6]
MTDETINVNDFLNRTYATTLSVGCVINQPYLLLKGTSGLVLRKSCLRLQTHIISGTIGIVYHKSVWQGAQLCGSQDK